jgi:hypothetical protein
LSSGLNLVKRKHCCNRRFGNRSSTLIHQPNEKPSSAHAPFASQLRPAHRRRRDFLAPLLRLLQPQRFEDLFDRSLQTTRALRLEEKVGQHLRVRPNPKRKGPQFSCHRVDLRGGQLSLQKHEQLPNRVSVPVFKREGVNIFLASVGLADFRYSQ